MKKLLLSLLTGMLCLGAMSQNWCATKSFEEFTHSRTDLSESEKQKTIERYFADEARRKIAIDKYGKHYKDGDVYVIPVVFHIVHNFGPENISDEQVYDQLRIMNEEFRKVQKGFEKVREEFIGLATDTKIEFRLATKKPDGTCTNGIERYVNLSTNFTSISQIEKLKPQIFWPNDMYLNCMVVGTIESSGGGRVLGYAQFPFTDVDETDGIVMVHDGIGGVGTGNVNRSSVTTHEVGHWLGLYHTWGKRTAAGSLNACEDDDDVDDTPNTKGSPSVCDLEEKSCGPLANVQNYMEYSFCDEMFTEGQKARMHYFLNEIPKRKNLWDAENLVATGTNYLPGEKPKIGFCHADFAHNATEPVCQGSIVHFADQSYENVTSWKWSFPGGNPSISTQANPEVVYTKPGKYSATLQVSDGLTTKNITKENIVTVFSTNELGSNYSQDFENYDFQTSDDFLIRNHDDDETFQSASVGDRSSRSMVIRNYALKLGKYDDIESSTLDLQNTVLPVLKFSYASTNRGSASFDELNIYVSKNCGAHWSKRKTIKGSSLQTAPGTEQEFIPTENEWKEVSIDLKNYRSENVKFRFEFYSGNGNNLYIDNINVMDVNELSENNVLTSDQLYPNPASSSFTIEFSSSGESITFSLLDISGKEVFRESAFYASGDHKKEITSSFLSPGIYHCKIEKSGRVQHGRLLIN